MQQFYQQKQEAKKLLLMGCYRMAKTRYIDLFDNYKDSINQRDKAIIQNNIGLSCFFLDQIQQAIPHFISSIHFDNNYPKPYYRLCQSYTLLNSTKSLEYLSIMLDKFQYSHEVKQLQNTSINLFVSQIQRGNIKWNWKYGIKLLQKVIQNGKCILKNIIQQETDSKNLEVIIRQIGKTHIGQQTYQLIIPLLQINFQCQYAFLQSLSISDLTSKSQGIMLKWLTKQYKKVLKKKSVLKFLQFNQQITKSEKYETIKQSLINCFYIFLADIQEFVNENLWRYFQYDMFLYLFFKLVPQQEIYAQQFLQNLQLIKLKKEKVSTQLVQICLQQPKSFCILQGILRNSQKIQIENNLQKLMPNGQNSLCNSLLKLIIYGSLKSQFSPNILPIIKQILLYLNSTKKMSLQSSFYYRGLSLLCRYNQVLQYLYNNLYEYKEVLNCESVQMNYLIYILLVQNTQQHPQIPHQIQHLIQKQSRLKPTSSFIQYVGKNLTTNITINTYSSQAIHTIIQHYPYLIKKYLKLALGDTTKLLHQSICNYAKDIDVQWKIRSQVSKVIIKYIAIAKNQLTIFHGILFLLKYSVQISNLVKDNIEIIKDIILSQNMYIVHGGMQLLNNALVKFKTLKEQKKIFEIISKYHIYYQKLVIEDSQKKKTDFSHPSKIYATLIGLSMLFQQKPDQKRIQQIKEYKVDAHNLKNFSKNWSFLEDQDLYRVIKLCLTYYNQKQMQILVQKYWDRIKTIADVNLFKAYL